MNGPDDAAPPAPDAGGAPRGQAKAVPRRRWPAWLAGGVLVTLGALAGAGSWLVGTESGARALVRLAQRASGGQLEISAPHGRVLGPLRIDTLRFASADLQVELDRLDFDWRPAELLSGRVVVDRFAAASLRVARRPSTQAEPTPAPQSLTLPLAIELARVQVGSFELRELPPAAPASAREPGEQGAPAPPGAPILSVTDFSAALGSDGRHHRLSALTLTLPQGRAELAGELDGVSPFALAASGHFAGRQDDRSYTLQLAAADTLLQPRIELQAEGEGLQGKAELHAAPFESVPLRALKLALGDVDPAAFAAGAPRAALRVEADLAAAETGDALLSGPLRITNLRPAPADQGGIPLDSLAGRLAWRADAVQLDALDIRLPASAPAAAQGRISGRLAWSPHAGKARDAAQNAPATDAPQSAGAEVPGFGNLEAALELAGVDTRALDSRLPRQLLGGRVELGADVARQHAQLDLAVGKARIEATAALLAGATDAAGHVPRSFTIDGRLRQLDPRALLAEAPSALLNLDIAASGTLAPQPEVQAKFSLPDSRFEGRPLGGAGAFRYAAAGDGFRLSDVVLALELAGNRLQANGDWGGPGDSLALKVDAPALAAIGHGLGGRAGAAGTVSGSLARPAGALTFYGEALRLPGELKLAAVNGEARLDAGVDGPFRLSVGLSGLASANARAGDKGEAAAALVDTAFLMADGTRGAHVLNLNASGLAGNTLVLRLQGGLAAGTPAGAGRTAKPAPLRWAGRLEALETGGKLALRLLAPAALELAPDRVDLAAAELAAGEQGRVRLLETHWTPSASVARGSLTGLVVDLRQRDATRSPATRADRADRADRPRRGPGPLTLGAEWNLRVGDTLDGDARLFREAGDVSIEGEIRTRLGLEALEAKLEARGDRLSVSVEARGTELGRVDGSASLRAERVGKSGWRIAPQAPLQGQARLDMPSIDWLGRLMRENVDTAGSLRGEFALGGTVAEPLASGRINGRGLQVALVDQGLVLAGGELDMSFDRDRLRLDRLAFVSPNRVRPRDNRVPVERLTATPGTLNASGEILLATGAGEFRFEAERLPLLQRPDRWLIVSGKGSGRSTWTTLDLQADFRADAGYLEFAESPAPSLGDDVVVLGREEQAGNFGVRADLRVALGDALYLSAMGLDTRLSGELRLRQQPGLPLAAVGTVATVGGSYRGYGQRLSIERGLVNFQGPLDNPGLNVVALRKGLAVEAGVEILGSVRRPLVKLVSEPSVPDPEKLSWIVLGRAPDAASGADLGLLLPAAQALLGGPGGGMTDSLSRSLGLDSFSIGQGELNSSSRTATSRVVGGGARIASGPTVSGQVLSVGKRLGSDLFLSFEQSLGGAETLVKLTYQLSRRLSLIARGGTDNSLDLRYSFSFR